MLQICKELFEKWNNAEIIYCHWKSNEHLMPGLDGKTDLDVLLSKNCETSAYKILDELSFLHCKSQYGSRYPGVTDWLGFDQQTGRMIHLHLHFQIVTGHRGMKEYNLPWSDLALKTRIKDKNTGVYMMEPNLEIVTLYSRMALKADIKKRHNASKGVYKTGSDTMQEIDYLKKYVSYSKVNNLLIQYYPKEAQDFLTLIKKDNLSAEDFMQLITIVTHAMQPYSRYHHFILCLLEWYYPIALHIRSVCKKRFEIITRKTPIQGLVVAFIGQDGAGKSTVTNEIEKWLLWKLDAHRYYLGSGDHYHSWQKSIQKSLPERKGVFLSTFSAFLSLTKYNRLAKDVLKSIKNAEKYRNKGGFALFDRYPQTQFLGINDGPKIRHMMKKTKNRLLLMIMALFAKSEENCLKNAEKISPDIVFKLILPPEESLRRKPHEDFEKIKRKHEIIKSLSFSNSKVYEIDATMNYEDELILIKQIIWQNIPKS